MVTLTLLKKIAGLEYLRNYSGAKFHFQFILMYVHCFVKHIKGVPYINLNFRSFSSELIKN